MSVGCLDVTIGVTESLSMIYLHLPQLLCELLFLRLITVMSHNFDHLLGHIKCCQNHSGPLQTISIQEVNMKKIIMIIQCFEIEFVSEEDNTLQ